VRHRPPRAPDGIPPYLYSVDETGASAPPRNSNVTSSPSSTVPRSLTVARRWSMHDAVAGAKVVTSPDRAA